MNLPTLGSALHVVNHHEIVTALEARERFLKVHERWVLWGSEFREIDGSTGGGGEGISAAAAAAGNTTAPHSRCASGGGSW
jgi:hypothetical protein